MKPFKLLQFVKLAEIAAGAPAATQNVGQGAGTQPQAPVGDAPSVSINQSTLSRGNNILGSKTTIGTQGEIQGEPIQVGAVAPNKPFTDGGDVDPLQGAKDLFAKANQDSVARKAQINANIGNINATQYSGLLKTIGNTPQVDNFQIQSPQGIAGIRG
jgi:hypothetical protein